MDTMSEFHVEAPQAKSASEGLAQGLNVCFSNNNNESDQLFDFRIYCGELIATGVITFHR